MVTPFVLAMAAAAAGACADGATTPQQATPQAPRAAITCDADCGGSMGGTVPTATDTALTVTVWGPTKNLVAATDTFTAEVSGGVGPYYYIWTRQTCYDDGSYCTKGIFAQGLGKSSASLPIYSDVNTTRIVVQVKDATTPAPFTGNAHMMVLGPATRQFPSKGSFACQSPPNYYPFWGYYKPSTGEPVGSYYIRSGCDGHKIYKPTTP